MLRGILFNHPGQEKARTVSYRADFFAPGGQTPVHTVGFTPSQVIATDVNGGGHYPLGAGEHPAEGIYEMTITATGSLGTSATSERSAAFPTSQPPAAPGVPSPNY